MAEIEKQQPPNATVYPANQSLAVTGQQYRDQRKSLPY